MLVAFSLFSAGYTLSRFMKTYPAIFASLLVMALGAGAFKPIPSGTIVRIMIKENSILGFGISYWSINLGAFIFPLFLVNWLKGIDWLFVFLLSRVCTGLMIIVALFFYKEPPKPESTKKLREVLVGAAIVLRDYKFVLMILIYSGFWILYFQIFHTLLWYLKDFVDMAPVEGVVNGFIALLGGGFKFKSE